MPVLSLIVRRFEFVTYKIPVTLFCKHSHILSHEESGSVIFDKVLDCSGEFLSIARECNLARKSVGYFNAASDMNIL
ncbi:MAG: hypothetical protein ABSE82_16790 [Nitrososphaerales archaeon]|jgi:hypothetical protein